MPTASRSVVTGGCRHPWGGLEATSSPASPFPTTFRQPSVRLHPARVCFPATADAAQLSRMRLTGKEREAILPRAMYFLGSKGGAGGPRGPSSALGRARREILQEEAGGLRGARPAQEGAARRCCAGAPGSRGRGRRGTTGAESGERSLSSAPSMLPQRRCAGRRVEEEREGLPGTAAC